MTKILYFSCLVALFLSSMFLVYNASTFHSATSLLSTITAAEGPTHYCGLICEVHIQQIMQKQQEEAYLGLGLFLVTIYLLFIFIKNKERILA